MHVRYQARWVFCLRLRLFRLGVFGAAGGVVAKGVLLALALPATPRVARSSFSPRSRTCSVVYLRPVTSGDWLSVFCQYLFHNNSSSLVSREDLKCSTSSG